MTSDSARKYPGVGGIANLDFKHLRRLRYDILLAKKVFEFIDASWRQPELGPQCPL